LIYFELAYVVLLYHLSYLSVMSPTMIEWYKVWKCVDKWEKSSRERSRHLKSGFVGVELNPTLSKICWTICYQVTAAGPLGSCSKCLVLGVRRCDMSHTLNEIVLLGLS
jgi:hypothetical protein